MMSKYSLPISVVVNDSEFYIKDKCDYRVIFDVFDILNDDILSQETKVKTCLYEFYQDIYDKFHNEENVGLAIVCWNITETEILLFDEMLNIINLGKKINPNEPQKPKLMDWEKDWHLIAPAINDVLHYEVRDPNIYTHWYTLIGAYQQIKDCYWAQIVSIRNKLQKGKKLDESDREFYNECKDDIEFSKELSEEDEQWLYGDW